MTHCFQEINGQVVHCPTCFLILLLHIMNPIKGEYVAFLPVGVDLVEGQLCEF
uniref:Uncharacterized protein n=1 Tax=Anguilla anguilla TaxID=7936 RepID=A0A0E9XWT2_ANGAN